MRQVPHSSYRYGIVGDGRLATHITSYFSDLGVSFKQWSRRMEKQNGVSCEAALGVCKVIWVLISDGAIVPFIEAHSFLKQKTIVHCSGSLVTDLATGIHPLMTFGPRRYNLARYQAIPFVLDTPTVAFRELFPELQNPFYVITPELKPFYHALCVMASNFSVILWQKLFRELEQTLRIPWQAALPYLEQTMANLERMPFDALTGPLARSDDKTIQKNLDALRGDRFLGIYQAMLELFEVSLQGAKRGAKEAERGDR